MLKIEKIDENNKATFLTHLLPEAIAHIFAINDIQKDPQHTSTFAAFENSEIKGYILIYTATDVLSVILEGEEEIARKLLDYSPPDKFIMHTPPNLLKVITEKFPNAKHYLENWMLVKRDEATFFKSELVRRLRSDTEDASKLAQLLSSRQDRPAGMMEKYVDWIRRMPVYGVFMQNQLVSYAGAFIQLPQAWIIGGIYTHPKCRNKGYAKLATSAITEDALKAAEAAALFVRSDNLAAIRIYEKLGYKKIGVKLWVDIGTGLKP